MSATVSRVLGARKSHPDLPAVSQLPPDASVPIPSSLMMAGPVGSAVHHSLRQYGAIRWITRPDELARALNQQVRMPIIPVGQALTDLKMLSPEELQQALELQKQLGVKVPLGELLVNTGHISRQDLQVALAYKMGFPFVDVTRFTVEPTALMKVPLALARRLKALPLMTLDGTLVVAAADPSNPMMAAELEFACEGRVSAAVADAGDLARAIPEIYDRLGIGYARNTPAGRSADSPQALSDLLGELHGGEDAVEDKGAGAIEHSDNTLVRLVNSVIIDAHTQGASDIHIETYPGRRKVRIRLRKDGRLVPYMELSNSYRAAIVARIKIMCDLDISERRLPQDGKIDFSKFSPQHRIELRVATMPTRGGAEDVVLRLLTEMKPRFIGDLGLTDDNLKLLQQVLQRPHGLVLCVGPTGVGKTTTLHAILGYINTPERKIWTAEDPIEISNPDLRQVQVQPKIGWTFAKALRSLLRADPDVIMVGEIRDLETAQMAVEASLTGHLVLSTLHTNSAAETVTRLLDMGMDPFGFADSLVAVLSQRLVRTLCTQCRVAEEMPEDFAEELVADYRRPMPASLRPQPDDLLAQWKQEYGQQGRLMRYHPVGCAACGGTGYKGRMAVFELMATGPKLRHLIQTGKPATELAQAAMEEGNLHLMRQDGILKVLAGLTTVDEVRANCVE
jgi:type II secretory ATPase GspE/PulE/Tfp pilus assembly ATPase PilB-like protein